MQNAEALSCDTQLNGGISLIDTEGKNIKLNLKRLTYLNESLFIFYKPKMD